MNSEYYNSPKYKHLINSSDMLQGCINRIFVSDDIEEVKNLYQGAQTYLKEIYAGNLERFPKKETAKILSEEEKKQYRCCFTGHRPENINQSEREVKKLLAEEIERAINQGKKTFITGMARGVDIWAAEIVLKLMEKQPDIKLIAAVPYMGFEERWSNDWKKRYRDVLKACNFVKYISLSYNDQCFQKRNMWMVDHSSLVIAYWDGSQGGTAHTVNYANRRRVPVINVYE